MERDTRVLAALPDEFDLATATAFGVSRRVIQRLATSGGLSRVSRGVYAQRRIQDDVGERWETVREDHLSRLRLALLQHPRHAASHVSAATLYGWPGQLHPEMPVNITALEVEPRSRREAGIVLHHSDSMVNDFELVDGLKTLTRPRTVADCLRAHRPPLAVAIADGALRTGSTTVAEVRQALDAQFRWVGRPRARRSLQLVDPRRESWLESYSLVSLHEQGIELPLSQVEVFSPALVLVGRVDGFWLRYGTVAEADGAAKYTKAEDVLAAPATLASERVVAERLRERELTDLGLEVVRWTTREIIDNPRAVAGRVQAAWDRGDIRRFTGHLRHDGAWLSVSPP